MRQPEDTPLTDLSDGDLLTRFAARRDESSFAEIVRRHGGMVLSVCRSVLGQTQDAEDAAQAVFLTLARRAASIQHRVTIVGWLYRVAWYVAARASEARGIRRRHEQEAARMKPNTLLPEDETVPLSVLHAALAELPEKYRVPLVLHHLEGRSEAQTATLLGCGISAASVRMTRGRQMLREKLLKRGAAISAVGLSAVLNVAAPPAVSSTFVAVASQAAVAGQFTSGAAISAQTWALSQQAIRMLILSQAKVAAQVVALVLLVGAAGLGSYFALTSAPQGLDAPPLAIQSGPDVNRTPHAIDHAVATTKPAWTPFRADGIEVVRAVQVNAGRCHAIVAQMPDGSSSVRYLAEIEMTAEDIGVYQVIVSAQRGGERHRNVTADQWKKLAGIAQRRPWAYSVIRRKDALYLRLSPVSEEPGVDHALQPAIDWLKLDDVAAREAEKRKLVALVNEKVGTKAAEMRDELKTAIAQAAKILTPEQRKELGGAIEKQYPHQNQPVEPASKPATAAAKWVHPNERGDGVHEGMVLLAKQGCLNLTVTQGVGLAVQVPSPTRQLGGVSFAQGSMGVNAEFLDGDAQLTYVVRLAGMDKSAELRAGALYLRQRTQQRDLSKLALTPEQTARIEELFKQTPDLETSTDLILRIGKPEADRIRALVTDWWHSKPTRADATDALLDELKKLDRTKTTKIRQFHEVAHAIGVTLTPEQRERVEELRTND